jgi:hypothetical protein
MPIQIHSKFGDHTVTFEPGTGEGCRDTIVIRQREPESVLPLGSVESEQVDRLTVENRVLRLALYDLVNGYTSLDDLRKRASDPDDEVPLETGDIYVDAQRFARHIQDRNEQGQGYWTAWYAARRTATALLAAANNLGVTTAQYETLRRKAAEVAPD